MLMDCKELGCLGLDVRFLGQKRENKILEVGDRDFATGKIAHVIDDETVAKMGHPVVWFGQMWPPVPSAEW